MPPKILLLANTDWYLYNFRLPLAERVRAAGCEVVLASPPGPYVPELEKAGFRHVSVPLAPGGTRPVDEIETIRHLVRLYRRERPTLAHHFTIKCVLYGSLAARTLRSTAVVNAVTGTGHVFSDEGLRAAIIRRLVKTGYRALLSGPRTRVVFQNEGDRGTFVDAGLVPRERTVLIRGSGVDCTRFRPEPRAADANGTARILFASRLLREKGVLELVAAAEALDASGLDVELRIAGDVYPENPSSLTSEDVDELTRSPTVRYLGHLSDVPGAIADSDIVALPSYSEGTPRILLEAAAAGKPIVATDIPGCRGLVEDGASGFLVPPRDVAGLTDALERLVRDPALWDAFGRRGREIVLSEFEEGIVLRRTLDVYGALIDLPELA